MHVFTYGSLMFPEVWLRVTGQPGVALAARLDGYARYAVSGVSYPGIVAELGSVAGVLYLDVTPEALARLDRFEGNEYLRREVVVTYENDIQLVAQAYVWRERLAGEAWNPDVFDLQAFLSAYCR